MHRLVRLPRSHIRLQVAWSYTGTTTPRSRLLGCLVVLTVTLRLGGMQGNLPPRCNLEMLQCYEIASCYSDAVLCLGTWVQKLYCTDVSECGSRGAEAEALL